ncbi:MAG: PD-(D/E)XK nuclease family protein, partial [Planctomycetes bacterium]|nr:PD-(D/E)XK nuclease family protein [Planctomycetota bacterium]
VFCLTRTHREGLQLAGYLREVGVRHAFYKQGGLLQTDEAADVLRLLRAVERPWSHAERAAAWITPFFGLALDDLPAARTLPGEHPLLRRLLDWQVLAERHDYEALFGRILEDSGLVRRQVFLREGERELTNYLHVFELLLDEVNHARVDLRELIAILGAWTAERRLPRGENGNVQRLESDRGAVQIMTLHTSKGLEATCVFLYGGLTRRKGDDVFLYHEELERAQEQADLDAGLDEQERRRRWGQRQRRRAREQAELADEGVFVYHDRHGRRVVHVGPPDPATLRRVREEQEDEERRLIYVASTRPRARLGLLHLGHGTPTHGKGPSARSFCYPKLGGTQAHVSARLADLEDAGGLPPGVELEQVTPSTDLAPPPAPDLGALERWSPPAALLDPRDPLGERCRALRQSPAHRARFATSYSALKQVLAGQGLAAELPAEAFVEPEPEADPEPAPHAELPAGTQTGLFVHEALERLPLASFLDAAGAVLELAAWQALPAVEEAFARAARHQGVAERHVAPAQALVHEALRVPLALPAEALPEGLRAVGDPRPEVEFCYPWPEASHPRLVLPPGARIAVDRGYVRGFMDLLFRHPASGRAYVLDWKTDRLAAYGPEALQAAVAERYQLQLELYLLALVKLLRIRDAADYAARCGGVVYAFLRGMTQASTPNAGVFARRPSWEEVLGYEQRLVTLGAEGLP